MKTEVVVIGAGFAGLSAAHALHQAGRDVQVIEARGRVGGRIWSETLSNGVTIERGGEFVLDEYDTLTQLVGELGLEFESHGFPFAARESADPAGPSWSELVEASGALAEHWLACCDRDDDASLATVVDTAPISEAARQVIRSRLTGTLAANLEKVGAKWVHPSSGVELRSGFTNSRRVKFGNQRIAEALAKQLDGRICFRQPASSVSIRRDGVQVRTVGGLEIDADSAVLALPFVLAATLQVDAPYGPGKAQAYARLGAGIASKLHVALPAPVKPRALQAVDAPFWVWMPSDAPDGTARAACSFAGSRAVQHELGVAAGGAEWLRRLEELGVQRTPESYPMLTSWVDDPWARHAYPYLPVGWTSEMAAALREPHGRLVFAGDYTTTKEAGMEGALESGMRAAGEVLETLSAV